MDVGEDTSLGDCDTAEKFVELFIVADGELNVTWDDSGLLVVTGGVAGKLKDLGSEILEDGCEVHGGTGANTGSIFALLQEATHSSHWELKASL